MEDLLHEVLYPVLLGSNTLCHAAVRQFQKRLGVDCTVLTGKRALTLRFMPGVRLVDASPQLSDELFRNPTREYRGTPFWSWNCELDEKELLRQIDELKEMGFGGFHMHCRAGMATEYLSEEFMRLIKSCVKKAKKEDMLACSRMKNRRTAQWVPLRSYSAR